MRGQPGASRWRYRAEDEGCFNAPIWKGFHFFFAFSTLLCPLLFPDDFSFDFHKEDRFLYLRPEPQ